MLALATQKYLAMVLVLISVAMWLFYLRRWFFELMGLKLLEVATYKVPKSKNGHYEFTYAEMFTRHQIIFNSLLIVVIVAGELIPNLVQGSTLSTWIKSAVGWQ
jgi:hypothetical protein